MSNFRVIEGGGRRPPEDFDVQLAVQSLRILTIELLRAIARGNDPQRRVTEQLIELYKLLGKEGITVDIVVETFLSEAHSELATEETGDRDGDDVDREIEDILLASLQVIAESLCLDDAAQGRISQRMRKLDGSLEARLHGFEERSRKHGWSYLENFLKKHFPQPRRHKSNPATPKEPPASKWEDGASQPVLGDRLRKQADPPKRRKPWSSRDSRSYLDPEPEEKD